MLDNDGREPAGFLPEVALPVPNCVVQVINERTGETLYCYRVRGSTFTAPVYSQDTFTLKAGPDRPTGTLLTGVRMD